MRKQRRYCKSDCSLVGPYTFFAEVSAGNVDGNCPRTGFVATAKAWMTDCVDSRNVGCTDASVQASDWQRLPNATDWRHAYLHEFGIQGSTTEIKIKKSVTDCTHTSV